MIAMAAVAVMTRVGVMAVMASMGLMTSVALMAVVAGMGLVGAMACVAHVGVVTWTCVALIRCGMLVVVLVSHNPTVYPPGVLAQPLAAVIAQLERLEQLGDGGFASIPTLFEHLGDVGAQMILDEQLVERAERLLNGQRLRDDVHAVVLVVDHFLDAAHLAFEDLDAVQGAFLDVGDHAPRLPLAGIGVLRMMRDSSDSTVITPLRRR